MNQDQDNKLTLEDLQNFTGSETFFRHSLARNAIYTEGVQYLAEKAGAYWLIDAIVSHLFTPAMQRAVAADERLSELQFWQLDVALDKSAVLTCRADSDVEPAIRQEIPFTDFPLESIRIWCGFDGSRWTLYLPSEH